MDKYGSVVKGKSFVQSADLKILRLIVFIANERISVNAALSNHNLVQSHVVGSRDEQWPPEQKPSNAHQLTVRRRHNRLSLPIMSRPELTGHAAHFYNEKEAKKYHSSSRMMGVQREITERAIELLRLDSNAYVLDIGCGSGLSGQVLEERGHVWVGCDISRDMLNVAKEGMEDSTPGDLLHLDMGTGLPFRPATFDAIISISALQWLCYSNAKDQQPKQRLKRFFASLYTVLKRGGRAVLQFYPETAEQAVLITETATQCGFTGGVVVDYPNSAKAKKHYLVLSFDRSAAKTKGLTTTAAAAARATKPAPAPKKRGGIKTKEWVVHKKGTERRRGKTVRPDTKYTARKRPTKF
jgi:18S rRNA (guanine1575-N7)-methyltransferase